MRRIITGIIAFAAMFAIAPAVNADEVKPWQVYVRPMFDGCDETGASLYSVRFNNSMYGNPQRVAVRFRVESRTGRVVLPPHADKVRHFRVVLGDSKEFISRVNGKVAVRATLEGLPCETA